MYSQSVLRVLSRVMPCPAGSSQIVSSTSDVPGLLLWDVRSGKLEGSLQTEGPVGSLDVSGMAGGGGGGGIRVKGDWGASQCKLF